MLLQTFIDIEKWDVADWQGAAFFYDPDGIRPPCLGLVFGNFRAGKQIFQGWRRRLGAVDRYEELRVSIVEGKIPGLESGYSIYIGSNPARALDAAERQGGGGSAIVFGRIHRMCTEPGSPNLARFKQDFAIHKKCDILPVSLDCQADFAPSIRKAEILFRKAAQVAADDLEAAVFPENHFKPQASLRHRRK
jgi:hypothetical protein